SPPSAATADGARESGNLAGRQAETTQLPWSASRCTTPACLPGPHPIWQAGRLPPGPRPPASAPPPRYLPRWTAGQADGTDFLQRGTIRLFVGTAPPWPARHDPLPDGLLPPRGDGHLFRGVPRRGR